MTTQDHLSKTLGFRIGLKTWQAIEAHRLARRLPRPSDAAREILERGLDPIAVTAAEARACGIDPIAAIRSAMATKLTHE